MAVLPAAVPMSTMSAPVPVEGEFSVKAIPGIPALLVILQSHACSLFPLRMEFVPVAAVRLLTGIPVVAVTTQPSFTALSHRIGQCEVESITNPVVPAAILAGSVPSVPNRYHPVPGVVIVGAVPLMSDGAEKALLDAMAFEVVPATAGQVSVAVPLVDP
jgi:hypothetical protein